MKIDERLRKCLIDAIASGNKKAAKEALDEIRGRTVRIRTFLDLMRYEDVYTDPDSEIKIIWDLEPDLKKLLEDADITQ